MDTESDESHRYDNVEIVNVEDGSVIKGHEAVKAYFEKEEKMVREHGSGITFCIYNVNWDCSSINELSSLGEVTVASSKQKIAPLLHEKKGPDNQTRRVYSILCSPTNARRQTVLRGAFHDAARVGPGLCALWKIERKLCRTRG